MQWDIKQIHNVSRPGEEPRNGDVVEIECVGGFVRSVDPVTRSTSEKHQQFVMGANGALALSRGGGKR